MTIDNPEEEQATEEDQYYVRGNDDVDHKMMESLFDLSAAYTSNNNDGNDDESDGNSAVPSSSSQGWTYLIENKAPANKAPALTISIDAVDHRLLDKTSPRCSITLKKSLWQ